MQQLFSILMVALMVILGGVPSVYIVVAMPVIFCQKVYGKIKYGKSMYD